ncbi:neuroplastin-like isoform X2 [Ornithodoros turicata]|uniref:neuroplastin-like isoform X2 n=1 Tax=Ornithodoros turicata TaxID=34597 RepID=UPI003139A887
MMRTALFFLAVFAFGNADESSGSCYHLVEGHRLELDCASERRTDVVHHFPFAWSKNNKRFLPPGPHVQIDMTRLIFLHAKAEDAGLYMCSNMFAQTHGQVTAGKLIHVITPVKVDPLPERLVRRVDGLLLLTCNASAIPKPRITWWHNGKKLEGGGRVRLLPGPDPENLQAGTLELRDITASDDGIYACKASHDVCGVFTESKTHVYVRLNAIQTNEEVPGKGIILDPHSTEPLVLQCNYTDDPSKDVLWFKDGSKIEGDTRYSINSDNHMLIVSNPDYGDAANYTCMIADAGQNATIVVRTNVSIEFSETSKNQVEGDPLTLYCKASGVPLPTITWLKDDEPLNTSDSRISLEAWQNVSNAKLSIQNLNFDDRAQYTCIASNVVGNDTITILVRVKDKLAALWPFLGICVEVAVLCAIIFVYEKKRVKPDFEESDTDQNPENKNLSDQKEGQDIRQRK